MNPSRRVSERHVGKRSDKFRWYFAGVMFKSYKNKFRWETIENTDRIYGGRSFEVAPGSWEKAKKREVKWKTSPLVAHAARIAKPTLCVVAIDVGVVAANEVVSGGFKKGIQFDADEKEREPRKFYEKFIKEILKKRSTFFLDEIIIINIRF